MKAEVEGGRVISGSLDRFPLLEIIAASGDLEKFEVTPERFYISWPLPIQRQNLQ